MDGYSESANGRKTPLPAPLGRRFVARLIDLVLIVGIAFAGTAWRVAVARANGTVYTGVAALYVMFLFLLWIVAVFVIYEAAGTNLLRATPGKRLLGLQISAIKTGQRPGLISTVWRSLIPILLVSLPVVGWFGIVGLAVSVLVDANRRGWHDQLAGTIVTTTP